MTSPLPPSADDIQLSITVVMAGQELVDIDTGDRTVSCEDLVVLAAKVNGTQRAAYQMTPAQAMAISRALADGAGRVLNAQIGDDGKPLPLAQRLRTLAGK
jgi:hypothetical protein